MKGWIKLHRKTLNSSIFDNPHLLKMWMWCLLKASHKGYKQLVGLEEVELKEGQFITGRNKGSLELNVNPSTFYKHLKVLEDLGMLELESNNKMTVVSVVNWRLYQGSEDEKEQPNNNKVTTKNGQKDSRVGFNNEMYNNEIAGSNVDNQGNIVNRNIKKEQQSNNKVTTKEQQSNTNKNVKKVKNEKNIEFENFFEEVWSLYPNKRGKGQVSDSKKREIFKVGEEFKRCINRYKQYVKDERKKGFEDLKYQNGSTFFNSGYIDYLDENVEEKEIKKRPPLKMVYRQL